MRGWKLAVAAAALVLVAACGGAAVWRINQPLPEASIHLDVPATAVMAPGVPSSIPLPATGSLAIGTSQDGLLAARDADTVHPIASLAKTMTALVVLDAHPLAPGLDGPTLVVTQDDVGALRTVIAEDGTYIPVVAGETLTERQLLLGMMLPSANNFAIMLARWVGGNDAAFVAQMNAKAMALGMAHTHFADPDGLSDQTVSTAADLVKLAGAAVGSTALLSITTQTSAVMPNGVTVNNIDTLVGSVPGWLGLKTGFTGEAGYCLLFAARRQLSGDTPPLTVIGVVLGQPARATSLESARNAAEAGFGGYVAVDLAHYRPPVTGSVMSAWGTKTTVTLGQPSSGGLVTRRGQAVQLSTSQRRLVGATPAPTTPVASIVASRDGVEVGRWPVVTTGSLGQPGLWWLLVR